MERDADFRRRLLATFKVEAEEHLRAMSAGLLDLEQTPIPEKQAEIVEVVFREAHSLKGAARSVNLTDIETLCQSLESTLAALKRQTLALSPPLLDLLHEAVNVAGQLLLTVEAQPTPLEKPRLAEFLQRLERAVSGDLPLAEAEGAREIAPEGVGGASPLEGLGLTPATTEKPGAPETVRISTAKLDALFRQVEELLSAKLAASQRSADLRGIHAALAAWKKEWGGLQPEVRALQLALERGGEAHRQREGAEIKNSRLTHLFEFLDRNDHYLKSLADEFAGLVKAADQDQRALGRLVDDLLEDMKKALMLPFSTLLEILPKVARDLARDQGKEAALTIQGGEIEVDRRILEEMKDPFIHLVRNCLDHGIEKPPERARKNKLPRGTITISISPKDSRSVEILVSDDGAGVEVAKVKWAALQAGVISPDEAAQMNEPEALRLIFRSGVSASPILTDLSGRGLGLAIVQEKVEKLGGNVTCETRPDAGTTFRIVLPLTLATFRGVLVRVGEHLFVLPTIHVERVIRINPAEIRTVEAKETIRANGRTVSLVRLGDALELGGRSAKRDATEGLLAVVLGSAERLIAFQVDEVVGEQEVLLKGLGRPLSRVRNVAGATVLGTGKVTPILNAADLIKSAARVSAAVPAEEAAPTAGEATRPKSVLVVEDSITARTLLKNILEAAGYEVKTAVDGVDAFTQLRTGAFDLVVSDVDMPRMNGFDLTAKIRADKKLAELPVVLITALASREDRERGVDVGANAYIVKSSFDQSNLLEVIRRLI